MPPSRQNRDAIKAILDEIVAAMRAAAPADVLIGDYATDLLAECLDARGVTASVQPDRVGAPIKGATEMGKRKNWYLPPVQDPGHVCGVDVDLECFLCWMWAQAISRSRTLGRCPHGYVSPATCPACGPTPSPEGA